jgi:hypothetical protein
VLGQAAVVGELDQSVLEERVVERHLTLLSKPLVRRLFGMRSGRFADRPTARTSNPEDPTGE